MMWRGVRPMAYMLALALVWTYSIAAQDQLPFAERHLVFLGNESLPPMVYVEGGAAKGVVVDLVKRLAEEMGRSIDIRPMNWNEAQELVAEGRADALIQINATPARLKVYDFSAPLLDSRFVIFTTKQRLGISDEQGLEGLRVGVERNGFPQLALQSDPRIRLVTATSILVAYRMLAKGQVDAVVADEWVGQYTLAKNNINDVFEVGDPIAVSQSSIAVKKGDAALLSAIDAGLDRMRNDGTYQAVLDKWKPQSIVFQTRAQMQRRLRVFVGTVAVLLLLFFAALALVLARRLAAERRYRQDIAAKSKLIAEKELILREVHHRIKNNMSAVIGLLSLQGMAGRDPKIKGALDDAANRITSMMVLYDRLYRRSSYETLSLAEYISPLVDDIISNFPEGERVRIVKHFDDIVMEPTTLHDIGIIVNELITNIMKHAFAGIREPEIKVEARVADTTIRISIADNGVGLPCEVEPEGETGFGFTLIRELTKQFGGKLEIARNGGTAITIEFEKPARAIGTGGE